MKEKNIKLLVIMLSMLMVAGSMLTACGGGGAKPEEEAKWPAMDTLSELSAGDITKIEFSRSTEGGGSIESTEDATQIEDIFLRLKEVKIKEPTEMGVEDDGLGLKIIAGDKSPSFSFEGDILVLEDGSRFEVENLGSLKSYVDKLIEEKAASAGPTEAQHDTSGTAGTTENSGGSSGGDPTIGATDYDISKDFWNNKGGDGIAYIYFNDFMLMMPDNEKYSFEMDGNSVTFYLFSAQQEGYGGRLVTIKAYDIDDHSYEQLPMGYHVAGVGANVNKRFIAIYPSDVQYNFNDEQQKADYMELYDHLMKIGEGAANSPFQTSDSN